MPNKPLLTYLKLPEYMIPYVFRRFGNPLRFSVSERIGKILCSSLKSVDDTNRTYSRISCSQRAYNIAVAKTRGQLSEEDYLGTPSPKDISQFVPILMPSTVMVQDEDRNITLSVATDSTHAIPLVAAQKLRQLIRQQFWSDMSQFHKDYSSGSTHKHDIFRFLRIHHIPEDQFENICRTETRLAPDM